jgi:hypothetical protein
MPFSSSRLHTAGQHFANALILPVRHNKIASGIDGKANRSKEAGACAGGIGEYTYGAVDSTRDGSHNCWQGTWLGTPRDAQSTVYAT